MICGWMLSFLLTCVVQADMENAYQKGFQYAQEQKGTITFDPHMVPDFKDSQRMTIPSKDDNPVFHLRRHEGAQAILQGSKAQKFKIDQTDPLVKNAQEAFLHPEKALNMKIEEEGSETEELKTCEEGVGEYEVKCRRYLEVDLDIIPERTEYRRHCPGHEKKERSKFHFRHWTEYCGGCQNKAYTVPKSIKYQSHRWVDECSYLEKKADQGVCSYVSTSKTPSSYPKIIKGESITAKQFNELSHHPYWEEVNTYSCLKPVTNTNTCDVLRAKGCVQVKSECLERKGNVCVVYKQTLKCSSNRKERSYKRSKDSPYGSDGKGHGVSYEANQEMTEALAKLSLLKEMHKHLGSDLKVFSGRALECSKNPVSFKDCCGTGKGWGQHLNLCHCSADEKDLALRRSKNLCLLVGTYCAKKIAGVCVSKRTSFCCFPSQIARLFQEQGRRQLGLGFGDPKSPYCRGLTPEELQRINVDALDLSELFEEVYKHYKAPNKEQIQKTLKSRLEQMKRTKGP